MDYQEKIISTIKKTLPAVVSIAMAKDLELIEKELPLGPFGLDPKYQEMVEEELKRAPKDEKGRIQLGGGSGFLVNSDGVILTNKHVVADPNADYSVIMSDNKKYNTEILAMDPTNDIAILKIAGKNFPSVLLGSANNLKLGQTVIAIGNALGQFQNSVSTGVVSGLSRLITAVTDMQGHQERLRGLIQTDAAINPGNSGGPLVDLEGNAIGINAAIVFGAQNIGFAIPINNAKKDLEEIKKYGRIRKPLLGIRYIPLNKIIQERFRLPRDYGVLVFNDGLPGSEAVIKNSAADKSGIKELDIITQCGGKKITAEEQLEDLLSNYSIGDKVNLTIFRKGKELKTSVILEEFRPV